MAGKTQQLDDLLILCIANDEKEMAFRTCFCIKTRFVVCCVMWWLLQQLQLMWPDQTRPAPPVVRRGFRPPAYTQATLLKSGSSSTSSTVGTLEGRNTEQIHTKHRYGIILLTVAVVYNLSSLILPVCIVELWLTGLGRCVSAVILKHYMQYYFE